MLTLTEAAKKRFVEVTAAEGKADHGLRLIIRNAGTPRPDFALNFVAPGGATEDDTVIDAGDFKVYVDADSSKYLDGASVDFIDNLQESGFKVEAPNAGTPAPEGPLAEAVMKVLDEKINPAVASHGGHVDLVAVENETAYLRRARVPAKTYPGQDHPVDTLASQVVLVSSSAERASGQVGGPASALLSVSLPLTPREVQLLADAVGTPEAPDPILPSAWSPRTSESAQSAGDDQLVDAGFNLATFAFLAWLGFLATGRR